MNQILRSAMFGVVALLYIASDARAAFISYTTSMSGLSGYLTSAGGSQAFRNATVSINLVSDTDQIRAVNVYGRTYYVAGASGAPATVTITGVGTFSITGSLFAFSYPTLGNGAVGFAFDLLQYDYIHIDSADLVAYDLRRPIGPVSGLGYIPNLTAIPTTAGQLSFDPLGTRGTGTFSASAVPEPSSAVLCTIAGAMGVATVARRSRRGQSLRASGLS